MEKTLQFARIIVISHYIFIHILHHKAHQIQGYLKTAEILVSLLFMNTNNEKKNKIQIANTLYREIFDLKKIQP